MRDYCRQRGVSSRVRTLWLFLLIGALTSFAVRAAETPPDASAPEEVYKSGVMAFQSGDYAGAAKSFQSILAMQPQGEALETILFSLGSVYFGQKELTKAETYYNRYLKEFPEGKSRLKALLAVAQIQMQSGRKVEAEKTFKQIAQLGGDQAGRAQLTRASLLSQLNKPSDAADVLRPLLTGGIKNDLGVQAAMQLADLEARQGHLDAALSLLDQLQSAGNLVDNPLQLDILTMSIGDGLLQQGERLKALRMYASVRPKTVVAELQKERIRALEKQIEANKASLQTNPKAFLEINDTNSKLRNDIADLTGVLEKFEKAADPLIPVRFRQAKAYDELDQKWETILIWESLVSDKDPKIREDAVFSIGPAFMSLGRQDDALKALDRYITQFPSGKYASQAQYLKGAASLEKGDLSGAETVFGKRLSEGDGSPLAEDMQFLLANTQFAQGGDPEKRGKYTEAIENYKKYLTKYPSGKFAQECSYRVALSQFQLGDYAKALEGFQAYIKKYPQGNFTGDAEYRVALCYNAAEKYDQVLKLCGEWRKKHEGEAMMAEVMALEGDAYAAKEMPAESAQAYRNSVSFGETDELLQYSLFEANKQYQKINRWDQISEMFSRFAERHPDHPAAVAAVYWVSKAKIKEGKVEEAKKYLADSILKNIDNRRKDAVEQLLAQLAQTCSKRPRRPLLTGDSLPSPSPVPSAAESAAVEAPTPRPTPAPLPPYDAEGDFAKYLGESNVGTNALAQARLRYAQAELAGYTKKPERQKELMASIYREFPADCLSAKLLAECGEIALQKGDLDKAESFYRQLMASFPKSNLIEYAYWGMGEISLQRNKPEEAVKWFDESLNKGIADAMLAQISYGKGRALLALGKMDESKALFEQVAGNKEWRGEITAKALLSLGNLEERRGNTAAAIQYYQRVFVAYQKYPDVVVEAYLKAVDGFVKLKEPDKAAAHLRELLSKPRLAKVPGVAEAQKKLEALPEASPSSNNPPQQNPTPAPQP